MEREYHPRNISKFKKGDLITRVKSAKILRHKEDNSYLKEDPSYIDIPLIYKGLNEQGRILVEVTSSEDFLYTDKGNTFYIPSWTNNNDEILAWHKGWDYANLEDELKKEQLSIKREKHKSTLKNTNLTAFLRGNK